MLVADLLERAQHGDEHAFEQLVQPHRKELHVHCYRMLGSTHDAEDAMQDALLRAWRSLDKLQGDKLLRPWLYKIATNTSLDAIGRRKRQRTLPFDEVPPADPHDGPGMPLTESVWIEPYPDTELEYEQKESVELAFVAALQHLPANQRAVLIMREVLNFSADECAELLETTTASVNSALQRARKSIDEKLPEESQQQTLRQLDDGELQAIVNGFMEAMDRGDVEAVVDMLTEDASWSMPPLATWYHGAQVEDFLRVGPLSGKWRWKRMAASANGQPAVAAYEYDDERQAYVPFALDVITLRGNKIAEVTSFITRTIELPEEEFADYPDKPQDARRLASVFEAFGLPGQLG